jgi:lipoyl(octanoyl) transferase
MTKYQYPAINSQKNIQLFDIGLQSYNNVWNLQKNLFNEVTQNRNQNYLILTEHHPIITLGKSSDGKNIVTNQNILESNNIDVIEIDRGGDVTFHGPGQIVGYPILNLNEFKKDINWYLRSIEEVIILTLRHFGISAGRIKDFTGVWINNQKICAIGIKVTRWITMHGFALNVSTQLDYFNHIVPCGLSDKTVTSMQEVSKHDFLLKSVKQSICESFKTVFNVEIKKREYALTV